jgi:8-oxo-dGTP pyrophosphatase MutT (NUDIX family)
MNQPNLTLPAIDEIRYALTGPLPGLAGQIKMAPQPRTGQSNRWDRPDNYREASVLLLLYPHLPLDGHGPSPRSAEPELHFVLIHRPEYPGDVHGGQISLPGGRREEGESLPATALREAAEEIGLIPEAVEIVGQLSPLYTPPSNFYIFPFVAFSPSRPMFQPNPYEVAELIETPLSLLLDSANRKEEIWYFQNYGERRIPFFDIFGHRVWGATAMILSEFLALLDGNYARTSPEHGY